MQDIVQCSCGSMFIRVLSNYAMIWKCTSLTLLLPSYIHQSFFVSEQQQYVKHVVSEYSYRNIFINTPKITMRGIQVLNDGNCFQATLVIDSLEIQIRSQAHVFLYIPVCGLTFSNVLLILSYQPRTAVVVSDSSSHVF